jgi:hypothetical protein
VFAKPAVKCGRRKGASEDREMIGRNEILSGIYI